MRNINLWTIVICLVGGLYAYTHYPRHATETPATPTVPAAPQARQAAPKQAFAPPPVLYKCENARGQTIYRDTPCTESASATVIAQQPAPAQATAPQETQADRDAAAAARLKALNEDLARKWDQRMAQRDRDLANEQAVLTAQANAANAACIGLRQEKEGILANLRRGGTAQWMNYWNDRFHTVSDALYHNRC